MVQYICSLNLVLSLKLKLKITSGLHFRFTNTVYELSLYLNRTVLVNRKNMSKLLGIFILVSAADSYSVSWPVSMSHLIPGNRKL